MYNCDTSSCIFATSAAAMSITNRNALPLAANLVNSQTSTIGTNYTKTPTGKAPRITLACLVLLGAVEPTNRWINHHKARTISLVVYQTCLTLVSPKTTRPALTDKRLQGL